MLFSESLTVSGTSATELAVMELIGRLLDGRVLLNFFHLIDRDFSA